MAHRGRYGLKNVRTEADVGGAELGEGERYGVVREARGGNVFAVGVAAPAELDGPPEEVLVLLPKRFNRVVWLRRGSAVVVRLAAGAMDDGAKVAGEVARVVLPPQLRELRAAGAWPAGLDAAEADAVDDQQAPEPPADPAAPAGGAPGAPPAAQPPPEQEDSEGGESDDGLPPLMANPNRRRVVEELSSEEEDDSD